MVRSASPSYRYKKPRNINVVSLLGILALVAGIYGAWKFVPVYMKRGKVDEVLRQGVNEAGNIWAMQPVGQKRVEQTIVTGTVSRIEALGITRQGNGLAVYFDAGYGALHADYTVVVKHPFGKQTVMKMERKVAIKRESDW